MKVRFQTVYNEWPTMLVLALDTTTRDGSLALARDGRLLESWSGDGTLTHARRLPEDILVGLARHGLAPADVTLFAVAAGPGSFTGLRIGIATIQGLAFAHRRPVVGVSALDALAYTALGPHSESGDETPRRLAALMDARRQEVFACLYERVEAEAPSPGDATAADLGELRILAGPEVGFPGDVLNRGPWRECSGVACVGDGAVKYGGLIEALGRGWTVRGRVPPLAPAICSIAARRAALGLAAAPHAVRPVYIRRPDAELARDRRQASRDEPDNRA